MQAQVLIEIKAKSMDNAFTYNIPDSLINDIKIGYKVIVPFGKRMLEGFVIDIGSFNVDYKLKDIKSVVGSVLTEELIELGKYMSKKTLANLISCYQTMLPKALKASFKTNINKKYEIYVTLIDNNYVAKSYAQKLIIDAINKV